MDKKATILTITLLFCLCGLFAQQTQSRIHYINKYKQIAVDEMHRTGIPASIKLAQAILESAGGTSALAKKANNHFGIKCGYSWTGKTMYRMDDDYDDKGNPIESCFRAYKNPESSFIAHSEFLTNKGKRSRYDFLFDYDSEDYKNWAKGLKKAGYATNPKYPQMLINIIETYELNLFDSTMPLDPAPPLAEVKTKPAPSKENTSKPSSPSKNNYNTIVKINDVDLTYAMAGETPESIANRVNIPVKRILRYNDELYSPYQDVKVDYRVYLQPKRGSFRGTQKVHKVKMGETMMFISQKYGVRLDKLYSRNRMAIHTEPLEGELIKIKGFKVNQDKQPAVKKGKKTPQKEDEEFFDEEIIATAIDDFDKPKISSEGRPFSSDAFDLEEKSPKPLIKNTPPKTSTRVKPTEEKKIVPVSSESVISAPKTTTISNTKNLHYTVKSGDTLYRISKKFGRSVNQIKEKNGLASNHLNIGQILIVN